MSAPAANAFSEPVRTMAPIEGSLSASSVAWFSSWNRAEFRAFSALGRLRVMSVTPGAGELTRMFEYSPEEVGVEKRGAVVDRWRVEGRAMRTAPVRRAVRMVEAIILESCDRWGMMRVVMRTEKKMMLSEKRDGRGGLSGVGCIARSVGCDGEPENP